MRRNRIFFSRWKWTWFLTALIFTLPVQSDDNWDLIGINDKLDKQNQKLDMIITKLDTKFAEIDNRLTTLENKSSSYYLPTTNNPNTANQSVFPKANQSVFPQYKTERRFVGYSQDCSSGSCQLIPQYETVRVPVNATTQSNFQTIQYEPPITYYESTAFDTPMMYADDGYNNMQSYDFNGKPPSRGGMFSGIGRALFGSKGRNKAAKAYYRNQ